MVALTTPATKHQTPSYPTSFKNDLYDAERIRKKILLNYSIVGSVLFIGLINEAVTWMSIALLVIAVFVLVYTYWFGIPVSTFENMYLHAVTNHTLQKNAGLEVDYGAHLRASELQHNKWLLQDPDYFGGKHLLYGRVQGVDMRISEVYYRVKPTLGLCDQTGVFNGIVVCAPVQAATQQPWIMTTRDGLYHQTSTDIPVLSAQSVINNPQFTQDVQQVASSLHQFSTEHQVPAVCSYVDGQFSVAFLLPTGFHYFRPSITSSVFNMQPVERYDRDLQFLIGLTTAFGSGRQV